MKAKEFYHHIFSHVSSIIKDPKEFQSITSIIFKHFVHDDFALILDKDIENIDSQQLDDIFQRLQQDEPIQYILHEAPFFNLTLFVDDNVLIPRPETEEMVLDIYKSVGVVKNILDIGTGSGCIALALKKTFPNANVDAIDKSTKSLEVARRNAEDNSLKVNFIESDILKVDDLETKYDLIVSNPPYVCKSELEMMSKRVVEYEPSMALFVDDSDPLIFYKKIITLAEKVLRSGGMLFLEINEKFGKEVARLLVNFQKVTVNKDINGKDRWISAKFSD